MFSITKTYYNWFMMTKILSTRRLQLLLILLLIVSATGCGTKSRDSIRPPQKNVKKPKAPPIDLQKIKPNELGKVLILEYHDVSDKEARWSRHYNNFKADLQRLYQAGYRPVSLRDFVRNRISVPAGMSPVVFTFDDATEGQFRYTDTAIDPNCAVAILEDFHEKHPGWALEATFYVYYPNPFRQPKLIEKKLRHIISQGMDIGNHTYSHVNLKKLSSIDAAKEIALSVQAARNYAPKAIVDSIALPYGLGPVDEAVLRSGEYDGQNYQNIAALLVGAEPALSPADTKFNPYRLPRVQAIQSELDMWLGYFKRHPEKRYISDGDPDTITAPKSLAGNIDHGRLAGKRPRSY
ncbi:MAG: polysaccharide deacetylase family protein [Armatimonadota bacterium]|nr:polysaccharide deacetylase family protein [Armatimonadota bacterium]